MKLIITDTNIFFDIISIGVLPIKSLIENGMINKSKGIKLLELLKEVNSSLPFDEIDKLIRLYKK